MPQQVSFVVERISDAEATSAHVRYTIPLTGIGHLDRPGVLRRLITTAVSELLQRGDEDAIAAYQYAGDDFNIGDLVSHGLLESVAAALAPHGISNLEIEILSIDDIAGDWNYDSVLVDPDIARALQSS